MGYLGDAVSTFKESAATGPTNRDYPLCLVCAFAQANGRFARLHCIDFPHPHAPVMASLCLHLCMFAPLHLCTASIIPIPTISLHRITRPHAIHQTGQAQRVGVLEFGGQSGVRMVLIADETGEAIDRVRADRGATSIRE